VGVVFYMMTDFLNIGTDRSISNLPTAVPTATDPVVGVKDDSIGVFPIGLVSMPFPLIPCTPHVSLGTQIGSLPKQRGWRKGGNLLELLGSWSSNVGSLALHNTAQRVDINPITHLSEGFYKGVLPDVLFVWGSDFAVMQALIDEIRFYLQKLNTMGFLLHTNQLNSRGKTSIDLALPAIVLVGGGIWYHRFLMQLKQAIAEVGFSYTEGKQLQQAVLGKICRGATFGLTPRLFVDTQAQGGAVNRSQAIQAEIESVHSLRPESSVNKPPLIRFKVAGGKHTAQRQVLHALGKHGVIVSIENEGLSSAERLEILQLHEQLQQFIIPVVYQQLVAKKPRKKPPTLAQLQQALADTLFEVGLTRRAFEAYEKGLVLSTTQLVKTVAEDEYVLPTEVEQCLYAELYTNLQVVDHYMRATNIPDVLEAVALSLATLSP
jgi:hypothetical protein